MQVTVLTENTVYKRGLFGAHGLSMLLETGGKRYLFDTGQTDVFLRNADKMKLDLERLDGIILSHGHYDHCGGMEYWARKQNAAQNGSPGIPIYINRKAFDKKFSGHPKTGELLFGGIHPEAEAWMKQSGNIKYTEEGCMAIAEDVYLLSRVPFVTGFESVPARFWKEAHTRDGEDAETGKAARDSLEAGNQISGGEVAGRHLGNSSGNASQTSNGDLTKSYLGNIHKTGLLGLVADHMEDEQLLAIREEQGLCVFAGCAHPGIVNCLKYVQSFFPGEHIHAIVAGMHLKGCSPQQLQKTIQALREFGADSVVPLHCTGLLAIAAIKEALGERCLLAEVGKKILL